MNESKEPKKSGDKKEAGLRHLGVQFHEDEKDENVSRVKQLAEEQLLQQELSQKKMLIRSMSKEIFSDAFGTMATQQQVNIDSERLHGAVKDAGYYSYGISAVEVWMLQEETGHLVRPGARPALRAAGWWTNPDFIPISEVALRRLDDPTHLLYDDPQPCPPGYDLAGILYATTSSHTSQAHPSQVHLEFSTPYPKREHDLISSCNTPTSVPCTNPSNLNPNYVEEAFTGHSPPHPPPLQLTANSMHHTLVFRDIHLIAQDPDCAKSVRLDLLLDAGFSHAAAIHFNVAGIHGAVLYYTSIGELLNQPVHAQSEEGTRMLANEYYLQRATVVIGAILASIDARCAMAVIQRRINANIISDEVILAFKDGEHNVDDNKVLSRETNTLDTQKKIITKGIKTWWKKCQGTRMQIPLGMSWRQAFFSFVGSVMSAFLLVALDKWFSTYDLNIFSGPLGAGIVSHYLLISAPASQPRTIVLSLSFSGFVSMLATYIPSPIWVKVVIALSVSTLGMGWLGAPHPPAGALAVSMTVNKTVPTWGSFLLTIVASIFLLIPAICINNLDKNRQYPIFWGHYLFKGEASPKLGKHEERK